MEKINSGSDLNNDNLHLSASDADEICSDLENATGGSILDAADLAKFGRSEESFAARESESVFSDFSAKSFDGRPEIEVVSDGAFSSRDLRAGESAVAAPGAAQGSKGLTTKQKIALGLGGSAGVGLGGWGISSLIDKFKGKDKT